MVKTSITGHDVPRTVRILQRLIIKLMLVATFVIVFDEPASLGLTWSAHSSVRVGAVTALTDEMQ
jgi:hypothetical protein